MKAKSKGKTGTGGMSNPNRAVVQKKGKVVIGGGNSKKTMSAKKGK